MALGTFVKMNTGVGRSRSRSPSSPGGETSLILKCKHPAFRSPDSTCPLCLGHRDMVLAPGAFPVSSGKFTPGFWYDLFYVYIDHREKKP